jgi:hypothetical protein
MNDSILQVHGRTTKHSQLNLLISFSSLTNNVNPRNVVPLAAYEQHVKRWHSEAEFWITKGEYSTTYLEHDSG